MMLTTKGRYAVMAMVEISMCQRSGNDKPVPLAMIAERQGITVPYLEQIFSQLRNAELVRSVRGPGGGYLLNASPEHVTVADIITAVDEPIKMTRCNHDPAHGCMSTRTRCLTHDLWDGLGNHIYAYLKSVSLSDVCSRKVNTQPMFMDQAATRLEKNAAVTSH